MAMDFYGQPHIFITCQSTSAMFAVLNKGEEQIPTLFSGFYQ